MSRRRKKSKLPGQRAAAKISSALAHNDNEYSNDAMKLLQGIEGDVGAACRNCLKEKKCKNQRCKSCQKVCRRVDTDEMDDEMSAEELAKLKKQLKNVKTKSKEQKEEESIETQQRRANFAQGTQRFRGIDKQKKERDARARSRSAAKKMTNKNKSKLKF